MAVGDELFLRDREWRRRNSMWMLPTLVCCGMLTWASFLYVGVRAKRSSWLAAAAFYGGVAFLSFVLVGMAPEAPDGTADSSSWQGTVGAVCFLAVWVGGVVHALIINPQWLAFLALPPPPAITPSFPASAPTNPGTLDEPWRSFVSQALVLQQHIATTVFNTPPGPMRDRLQIVADHVGTALVECQQVAQGGQRMSEARARIDTASIAQQLDRLPTGGALEANPSLAQAAHAFQAQLDAATRIDLEITSTYNALLLLNARLGEAGARMIELSARPEALKDAAAVDADVESVVEGLVAIRQAFAEIDGSPTGT